MKTKLAKTKEDLNLQFKAKTESIKTLINDIGKTCDNHFKENLGSGLYD